MNKRIVNFRIRVDDTFVFLNDLNDTKLFSVDFTGKEVTWQMATDTLDVYSTGAGAYRFYVDMGGTVHATSIVISAISDERLKENIKIIENAIEKISMIAGYTYEFNDVAKSYGYIGYKQQVGVLAQELQKVLPQAIKLAPFDRDSSGNSKSGENYLTVQYEKIVPLLIQAIKEQQSSIDELLQYIKDNG